MAKAKVKLKKAASKPATKAAKPAKSAEKAKLADASKSKSNAKALGSKSQPAAAKGKAPVDSKKTAKTKAGPKKESKAKKTEELDLFDDGDVTESEELLEYQEELDSTDDDEVESEETDSESDTGELADDGADDSLLEAPAVAATPEGEEDIILTDAEGNRYCRAKDCDQISTVEGYCRYHYLLFWKKIQVRKEILQDGKLEKYVDDLTSRYPDKFLEMLRKDLRTTKDFLAAIAELEIDESAGENEFEEDAQTFIDEVRGLSDTGATMEDDEF